MRISWNRRKVITYLFILQYLTYSSANSYSILQPRKELSGNRPFTTKNVLKKTTLDMVSHSVRGGEAVPADVTQTASPLTKLRQAIFPIYGKEVKKFLLIGSIKFFIILALTLTRDTKDTLVVTQCGAEAIAFLKVRPKVTKKYLSFGTIGAHTKLNLILVTLIQRSTESYLQRQLLSRFTQKCRTSWERKHYFIPLVSHSLHSSACLTYFFTRMLPDYILHWLLWKPSYPEIQQVEVWLS